MKSDDENKMAMPVSFKIRNLKLYPLVNKKDCGIHAQALK